MYACFDKIQEGFLNKTVKRHVLGFVGFEAFTRKLSVYRPKKQKPSIVIMMTLYSAFLGENCFLVFVLQTNVALFPVFKIVCVYFVICFLEGQSQGQRHREWV